MSLKDVINVKTHYTRSINLERDLQSIEAVSNYIPTSRALRTLERVAESFSQGQKPRAWSLVGPYGSGKSSFALFLAHLLEEKSSKEGKAALKRLKESDQQLHKAFQSASAGHGYLKVLITGSPEPLANRFAISLAKAVEDFYSGRPGKNPRIVKDLKTAAGNQDVSVSTVLSLMNDLETALHKAGGKGVLIVFDELGKFLEYEARHYGANDIYLLQALAEHACQGKQVNVLLFVLLHQSFEQYAKGLGESLKNEWSKVQGRFEEVPFLESAEQVLRVVSAAFEPNYSTKQRTQVTKKTREFVDRLSESQALPGVLSNKEATELLVGCYPFHPVTAMLLPALCQKIAQNERTLFSYLGSHEEHGVLNLLETFDGIDEYIMPHHVFDYFITNQSAVLGDYLIHRRWIEVVTALDRMGDANQDAVKLLKTIGLFNIVGAKGNLKASKDILSLCVDSKSKLNKALKTLTEKSVVTYRRFNNEYRVWQGSDFDIEETLNAELSNMGNFALAEELNRSDQLEPIVARKYSIENGALRYFNPIFADAKSYLRLKQQEPEPRIIFFLAFGEDDKKIFAQLNQFFSTSDILVLCATSHQIRDAVAETIALRKIQAESQTLNSDPVAKREFEDRLFSAEKSEASLIRGFFDSPQNHQWCHTSEKIQIQSKRELQRALSEVLEKIYPKAPIIHNELINRDRPSTQASAARNKLLHAMQHHGAEADLGFEKFPAEKAIYRAVLKTPGIHSGEGLDDWGFRVPKKNKSRAHFVWKEIEKFLDSTEDQDKSFVQLSAKLMSPPYGVKAGLLPILYFAAYQIYEHELALYENRRYCPTFTDEMIERFTKRPDEFTVQRFRIQGLKASIFSQYSKVIHGDTKQRTILELARPLATFMGDLPEYAQKTRRGLSPQAQKVRNAFNLAKSPERLLFEELPKALGHANLSEKADQEALEAFSESLTESLRELRDAHKKLLEKEKSLLAQAFNREPDISLEELRKVSQNWYGLEAYTVDTKGLSAFISRLTKVQGNDDEWFENILMFLGHKPSKKWLDSDQDTAEYRLNDFARRIIDLEKLRLLEKERSGTFSGDVDFFLLRSVKKGHDFMDEVIAVDQKTAGQVKDTRVEIEQKLAELGDKELRLAALAEVVDRFLNEYRELKVSEQSAKFNVIKGGKSD